MHRMLLLGGARYALGLPRLKAIHEKYEGPMEAKGNLVSPHFTMWAQLILEQGFARS